MFSVQYTLSSVIEDYGYVGVQPLAFGSVPDQTGESPNSDPIDALSGGIYRLNYYGFWEIDAGLALIKRDRGENSEFSCWGWFDEEEPFYGLQRVNVYDDGTGNERRVAMSFHAPVYATSEMVDGNAEFKLVFGDVSGSIPDADVHSSYSPGENWIRFTYLGDA